MNNKEEQQFNKFGSLVSLGSILMVIISFSFAIFTSPKSGAYCPGRCIAYPYPNSTSLYPFDYIWMLLMSIALILYLILFTSIHFKEKKIFSHLAMNFALLATLTLVTNYLIQILVIQSSLVDGEQEGIALLTQYNVHGIFIAMEVIGYIFMVISFGFLIFTINGSSKEEKWISIILYVSVILSAISFILLYSLLGLNTNDSFEIVVILIPLTALIILGLLFSKYFKNSNIFVGD